ncbi:MAG: hypothetical protein IJ065_00040 [Eubacterium sp.]|nr:hypothetical protein [Eubacterium sp.]
MKDILKVGVGVGITSALALMLAIPVFNDVDTDRLCVKDLKVESAKVYVSDEETVGSIVTEAPTEEVTEESVKSEENSEEDLNSEKSNSITYIYTEEELDAFQEYIDNADWDKILEESKQFDINKYDADLRAVAEEYLGMGYYLSDAEYAAVNMRSGTGVEIKDENGNVIGDKIFCNGFDVVDDDNGNNTFYISVLKLTPEEFDEVMTQSDGMWFRSVDDSEESEGSIVTYESSDGLNNVTITYNKETGVFIQKNEFTEAALNAVG